MKKYGLLIGGTLAVLAMIFGAGRVASPKTTTVELMTVESATVRKTVECNGRVQASSQEKVYVPFPCIADEVYVRQGQRVKQGDALFSVNLEATQQVGAQLGGISTEIDRTVTAPVSGVIQQLSVQEGAVTNNEEPCAVIASDGGVYVTVSVREKYVSGIAVGQAVELSGVAFKKEKYHGTITEIADSARQELSGTVTSTVVDAVVLLEEEDVDDSLRSGLNARASVITAVIENALPIPYECIGQNEEGREFVYVYGENGTARRVYPEWGETCADGVLVVSGVAAGDRLVCDPETLSGDTVRVRVE